MRGSARMLAGGLGLALSLAGCKERQQEAPAPPTAEAQRAGAPATPATPLDLSRVLASFAPLVDSVKAAVVNVEVRSGVPHGRREPADPFGGSPFGPPDGPFGPERGPREPPQRGLGSGFIIDPKGLVLTNHHVVEGAVDIGVQLGDGREFTAKVLGTDPLTDVAVLQLQGDVRKLPVVTLGDSDAVRVGDWAVAIGDPFGLASSVSVGILSAKARNIQAGPFDDFLQTDAAINPGNSGGPLFNVQGQVIGINTAIIGQGTGIGFAVPSNLVKALLPQLEKEGVVTRGWLGVTVQDLTPGLAEALGLPVREGTLVSSVSEGTPAKNAGLQPDDFITAVDGQPVKSGRALTRAVAEKRPGSVVKLTVYRNGHKEEHAATLGTRPDVEGVGGAGEGRREAPRDDGGGPSERPVGLAVTDVDPRLAKARKLPTSGAMVVDVAPGSPAERAGLAPGMVVVEARGQPVRRAVDLMRLLSEAKPGDTVLLRVAGDEGERLLLALTLTGK